ncbi:hypothetical protein SAMN04488011_10619 [Palleronia pelagia]|uniref:Uncharacterized protein n=1 Tax=Palleronia pelagia TaxID=387096 RepID=A0A1H8J303_9RHOB|nr:hypothetical protein SAMN04488011_10619 [Palleronia pelagia]
MTPRDSHEAPRALLRQGRSAPLAQAGRRSLPLRGFFGCWDQSCGTGAAGVHALLPRDAAAFCAFRGGRFPQLAECAGTDRLGRRSGRGDPCRPAGYSSGCDAGKFHGRLFGHRHSAAAGRADGDRLHAAGVGPSRSGSGRAPLATLPFGHHGLAGQDARSSRGRGDITFRLPRRAPGRASALGARPAAAPRAPLHISGSFTLPCASDERGRTSAPDRRPCRSQAAAPRAAMRRADGRDERVTFRAAGGDDPRRIFERGHDR